MLCELLIPAVAVLGLITGMWLEAKFNAKDWGKKPSSPDEHEELTK